jgi:hypothetical protein
VENYAFAEMLSEHAMTDTLDNLIILTQLDENILRNYFAECYFIQIEFIDEGRIKAIK